ncbi:hypothetical protein AC249_AIPGENE18775 [Exaiptasia diaphana]|nr:hypothetical protein AC249_AIPGENE18775 [Exaiptasia diaphana]
MEFEHMAVGFSLSYIHHSLETESLGKYHKVAKQIEYGRNNEDVARTHYKKLMSQTHVNFNLVDNSLQISERDHFIAASPDNLKACKCCGEAIVEYKCPYSNRHLHPREAFLDKTIGGKQKRNGTYYLDPNQRYYFQVQGAKATMEYDSCDFVIYTENSINNCDGSIFVVQVPFSKSFWEEVRQTVRQFYLTWMLPIIFQEVIDETGMADDTQPTQMTVDYEMTKKESKDIADDRQPAQMIVDDEMTKESKHIADDKQPAQMIEDDDLPTSSNQCSIGDLKGVT